MRILDVAGLRPTVAVVGLLVGASLVPAAAKAPDSSMLQALDHGAWELNYRGGDGHGRMCARSGRELIQIRHRADRCRHVVIEDKPDTVTVQYSCPGDGYGRTSIRRETGDLMQVDSQGIEKGMPFHLSAEARQVGECRGRAA